MTYEPHPLIQVADKHLDATLDRFEKGGHLFWIGQMEWGRSIMTVSSGALVLSISVAQFLIGKGIRTQSNLLLPTSWILLAVALILSATHHTWAGAASL